MKKYNLKFGLYYKYNEWHVCIKDLNYSGDYAAYCNSDIYMGFVENKPSEYIHPIKRPIFTNFDKQIISTLDKAGININLTYNRLCPKCKKKFQLTEEDINHYLVLAKFGIKV